VQGIYQIQYRTQNAAGLPLANVLTAIVPFNPNYDALFSYIYFSDSPSPDWNPSFDMTLVPGGPVVWTKQQLGPVISALNQGWIVGVPDDGGPYADFPSGPTAAYTTLDSMRALLQSREITGLLPSATITLNGYSGGGVTAAWVAEIHPAYAPEVNIAGIALGGLVPKFKFLAGKSETAKRCLPHHADFLKTPSEQGRAIITGVP
jgi:pimeloyl-ACP methyl ester carboxylesterase